MTEDQNPFVHPAQARLVELIDQAERELFDDQDKTQPLSDPLERFHVAEEWGIDPWVAAMYETSQALAQLKALALSVDPDGEVAKKALMAVITKSLQALVLYEEGTSDDQALDDGQLADFLDRLVIQLDARIEKLRASGSAQPGDLETDDHLGHVHAAFLNESATRPITTVEAEDVPLPDEDMQPGLAFTGPYGDVVAGEGPVQDPPAREVQPGYHTDFIPPAPRPSGLLLDRGPGIIQVEEVPADQVGHDFVDRNEEKLPATYIEDFGRPPVDLEGADRALAREVAALRQTAGGSSAVSLGGRHAGPDDTQPDLGETGRRAKEE